ncbi:uncharacterized protein LOC116024830 [Ipomoea triloba]|uniref:uncharacterized protein LOC116024830 n=1 Tax=Ipomoea triloba TaxID=35885 RepID=UPI00125CF5F7|nr:uncharacterized protein LOC116024830 [Ipomoea triloba]
MVDRKPVIIIISSDEDEGSGETKPAVWRRRGNESWESWDSSDYDDDCVILEQDDDDDDDCVILEEDPDKPTRVVNEKVSDDSDDLVVVSEKGQVACRDYPHPRHLCVKFPFATTPHESHCDKCHCYVCDALAPCLYWTKDEVLPHCDATDKMWIWRHQRENRKKSDEKVEPNESLPLRPPVSDSVTQNQVPRDTLLASSLSRNHEMPNIALQPASREQPGGRQNGDQRMPALGNPQKRSPHHLQHKNTNPTLSSHHIASELNNLNLGPADTDPPCVLESVTLNQFIAIPATNASVSQLTNLLNQNDRPNSNSNSSRYYPVPTITSTDMNSQTLSNPHPTLKNRTKWKTQRP